LRQVGQSPKRLINLTKDFGKIRLLYGQFLKFSHSLQLEQPAQR